MASFERIAFIGTGRVAQALAPAMHRAGLTVSALSNRNLSAAKRLAMQLPGCVAHADAQAAADAADLVFLTVPDDVIAEVVQSLRWRRNMAVVHCSGATELEVLHPASSQGAAIGAFHPLQAFSDPQIALSTLPGCAAAIEAEAPLDAHLSDLAHALGMRPLTLPAGMRVLYHLSGSYAASFIAVLLNEAAEIWTGFGLSRAEALAALLPLAQSSLVSIRQQGPVRALTGPISRGDAGTLAQHLEALQTHKPASLALYTKLAEQSLLLAQERGLPEDALARMRQALDAFIRP